MWKSGGNDANPCIEKLPCLTIGKAIDIAEADREILVGPGLYTENIVIKDDGWQLRHGLVLKSKAGRYATMIKARNPKFPIVTIESRGVRFGDQGAGFTVLGNREDEEYTLSDYATSSQEGIVINNSGAHGNRVEGNRALGLRVGFRFYAGSGLQVRNNIAKKNMFGFYCWQCDQALFEENQAMDNHNVGMLIGWNEDWGAHQEQGRPDGLSQSNNVSVLRNKISMTHYHGLMVSDTVSHYSVVDNVIDRTTTDEGVVLYASGESLFQGNIIAGDSPRSVDDALDIKDSAESEGTLHVLDNLAVSMASGLSSDLRGQTEVTIERNRAVGSKWAGFRFTESPLVPEIIQDNASYASESGCGMENLRTGGAPIEYQNHFYGAGDMECGDFNHSGAFRDFPVPLNVNGAKSL